MLQNAPSSSAFTNGIADQPRAAKRKASLIEDQRSAGRVMSSTQPRVVAEVREIRAPRVNINNAETSRVGIINALPMPGVQSLLRAVPLDEVNLYLEAENSDDEKRKNKITYTQMDVDIWIDYLPAPALAMAVSERFSAVACEDGEVRAYSPAGRQ